MFFIYTHYNSIQFGNIIIINALTVQFDIFFFYLIFVLFLALRHLYTQEFRSKNKTVSNLEFSTLLFCMEKEYTVYRVYYRSIIISKNDDKTVLTYNGIQRRRKNITNIIINYRSQCVQKTPLSAPSIGCAIKTGEYS